MSITFVVEKTENMEKYNIVDNYIFVNENQDYINSNIIFRGSKSITNYVRLPKTLELDINQKSKKDIPCKIIKINNKMLLIKL